MTGRPGALTRWDAGVITWLAASRLVLIAAVYPDRGRIFNGDSPLYEALGLALARGEGYVAPAFGPFADLIRPPGFPAFIGANYAVLGAEPLWPILWNVVFIVLIYVGLRALLVRMGRAMHPAVGVVFALDVAWLLYSKELVTEPLFTALLLGSLLALLHGADRRRPAWLAVASLGVGLCALIKPIALYLPIVLAAWLVGRAVSERWRWRPAAVGLALLMATFLPAVAPWYARNAAVHGTPTFTSIQAGNLLGGHAAFVWADVHGLTHVEAVTALEAEVRQRLAARYGAAEAAPYASLEAERGAVARSVLAAYPARYARAILRGVAVTLFDPGRLVLNRTLGQQDPQAIGLTNTLARDGLAGTFLHMLREDPVQVAVLLLYLAFLGVVTLVAAIGLAPAFRAAPAVAWLCLLVGGYLLVLGGPHGYARFRLYVFPFVLVAFHFGVEALLAWWRARKRAVPYSRV